MNRESERRQSDAILQKQDTRDHGGDSRQRKPDSVTTSNLCSIIAEVLGAFSTNIP